MPDGPQIPADLLWRILVLDIGGLAIGILLLSFASRELKPARDVRIFVYFGIALGTCAFLLRNGLVYYNFGMLRLFAHALFCVLAPLLILRGLWVLRRHAIFGVVLLVCGMGMEGVYLYARHVEPYWLDVTRYEVVSPRLADNPAIKIIVVADLQTDDLGAYEDRVFATIDAQKPDLILFAGDYLQCLDMNRYKQLQPLFMQLFTSMAHKPPLGMIGVEGDIDIRPQRKVLPVLKGTGVRFLRDDVHKINDRLQVIGLSVYSSRLGMKPWIRKAISTFPGFTIVLGHAPEFGLDLIAGKYNDLPFLYVGGHCHGGQVVIPFFGPPITLSRIPRTYASGFHHFGKARFFISRGVGMERNYAPRLRLFCRPELAVITLRGASSR